MAIGAILILLAAVVALAGFVLVLFLAFRGKREDPDDGNNQLRKFRSGRRPPEG
jgi:hypothetical protein